MQVNAILTSTDQTGKKQTTTITYLRASQKSKAATLTQALNALTANNYVSTQVNEINVDLAGKPIPTLEIGQWESGSSSSGSYYFATVNYTGDGNLYIQCSQPAQLLQNNTRLQVTTANSSFSGTIYATETDTYSSVTRNFSR